MHAVTIVDGLTRSGRSTPTRSPGHGEILVAVAAAGINAADIMQRKGLYPAPPGSPPGHPWHGVRRRGGGTRRWDDPVRPRRAGSCPSPAAVLRPSWLSCAESVAMSVPASMEWDQAGGFPEAFYTAHDALFTQASLRSRREGAHLRRGRGGRDARQCSWLTRPGPTSWPPCGQAPAVVMWPASEPTRSSTPPRFPATVRTTSRLELVGAPGVEAVLPVLAMGGRIMVIGVSGGGAKLELNLLALMGRRAAIGGSMLRGRTVEEKAAVARALEEMLGPRWPTVPLRCRWPRRFPSSGRPTPTSGSRRAASSGRSCSSAELPDRSHPRSADGRPSRAAAAPTGRR